MTPASEHEEHDILDLFADMSEPPPPPGVIYAHSSLSAQKDTSHRFFYLNNLQTALPTST